MELIIHFITYLFVFNIKSTRQHVLNVNNHYRHNSSHFSRLCYIDPSIDILKGPYLNYVNGSVETWSHSLQRRQATTFMMESELILKMVGLSSHHISTRIDNVSSYIILRNTILVYLSTYFFQHLNKVWAPDEMGIVCLWGNNFHYKKHFR